MSPDDILERAALWERARTDLGAAIDLRHAVDLEMTLEAGALDEWQRERGVSLGASEWLEDRTAWRQAQRVAIDLLIQRLTPPGAT